MRQKFGMVLIALSFMLLASGCSLGTPERPPQALQPAVSTQPKAEPTLPPPPAANTPTPSGVKPALAATPTSSTTRTAPTSKPGAGALTLKVTAPVDESVVNVSSITVVGQTLPGAVVSINGDLADVDASGKFQLKLTLDKGPNILEITASDAKGNELNNVVRLIYEP